MFYTYGQGRGLSTCRFLVKNLKRPEFNVHVSETARQENIFNVHFFKERNGHRKSHAFICGCPLAGNNNEAFCIYTGVFWVLAVRLSLGSRKVDLGRRKEQRTATLPA